MHPHKICPNCQNAATVNARDCVRCSHRFSSQPPVDRTQFIQPPAASQPAIWRTAKNRYTTALLAICLGGLGVHRFYLGQPVWGLIYLLTCWTFVPMIAGAIECLIYLVMTDTQFEAAHGTGWVSTPYGNQPYA